MPLLSLVIPFYNHAQSLPRLLASAAAQSIAPNMEVVLVDDCSDESCETIITPFQDKFFALRLIRLQERAYTKNARLRGMKEAQGKVIAFADADDLIWGQTALESNTRLLLENNADIVHFPCVQINEEGLYVREYRPSLPLAPHLEGKNIFTAFAQNRARGGTVWNKVYSQELVKSIIPQAEKVRVRRYREDVLFSLLFFLHARKYISSPHHSYGHKAVNKDVEKAAGRFMSCWYMLKDLLPHVEKSTATNEAQSMIREGLQRYCEKSLALWSKEQSKTYPSVPIGSVDHLLQHATFTDAVHALAPAQCFLEKHQKVRKQNPSTFTKTLFTLSQPLAVRLRNTLLWLHARVAGRKDFNVTEIHIGPQGKVCMFGEERHYAPSGRKSTLRTLFGTEDLRPASIWKNMYTCDFTVLHYLRNGPDLWRQIAALVFSILGIQKLYFIEPGFISSFYGYTEDKSIPTELKKIYSYIVDDMGFYYDAIAGSRVRQRLTSTTITLTPEQKAQINELISYIVINKLSKYNHQTLEIPDSLKTTRKKVLVVDQAFEDASVWRGCASEETFRKMLDDAINENPDAAVFIKSHPDRGLTKKECYFSEIKNKYDTNTARIQFLDTPVNPYTVLAHVDTVYTATSQLGFEALLAGKELHTYGMPIYKMTKGVCHNTTRNINNNWTKENLFYALYLMNTIYFRSNSDTCDLKELCQFLLSVRKQFFEHQLTFKHI